MKSIWAAFVFMQVIFIHSIAFANDEITCVSNSCHPDIRNGRILHDPVQKNDCEQCHVVAIDNSTHECKKTVEYQYVKEKLMSCLKCKYDFAPLVYSTSYSHKPVKDGHCLQCHDPHKSEHEALLVEEYYMGDYGRVSRVFNAKEFELCWKCHPKQLLTEENTMSATKFRDGEENLHYIHNSKERSVSCRTCHALIHGSLKDKLYGPRYLQHMNAIVSDWYWEYEVTSDGGSCIAPCHGESRYHRRISTKP